MVQLTRASSDVPSETDKISDNTAISQGISEVPQTAAVISEEGRKDPFLVIGTTERLKVTHVESPKEVYFMKSLDKESFSKLYDQIAKVTEGLEGTADSHPAVGSLVLVKASDGIWYRGKVLSIEGSSHLLFYAVDFGFTEKVKRKQIMEIPATLSSLKTHHYLGKIIKDCHCATRLYLSVSSCEVFAAGLGGGKCAPHRGRAGGDQGEVASLSQVALGQIIIQNLSFNHILFSTHKVKVISHDQKEESYIVATQNLPRNDGGKSQ